MEGIVYNLHPPTVLLGITINRYVLGAVETFLDAVPSAGFFQGTYVIQILF